MKKEKTVKTHTRKTKSGKTVTVKQHTAKYDAAEQAKEIVKKAGAGAELERVKRAKLQDDPYKDFGFTAEEFAEWYEGTGSKADKKVEKALRKALGRKAYDELNDAAAEGYKKGGAAKFFSKEVGVAKPAAKETPAPKEPKKVKEETPAVKEKTPKGKRELPKELVKNYSSWEDVSPKDARRELQEMSDKDFAKAMKSYGPGTSTRAEEMDRRVGKHEPDDERMKQASPRSKPREIEIKERVHGKMTTSTYFIKAGEVYTDPAGKHKRVPAKGELSNDEIIERWSKQIQSKPAGKEPAKSKSSKEPKVKEPKSKAPKAETPKDVLKKLQKDGITRKTEGAFQVNGLRMDSTFFNERRLFVFDKKTGEVYGRWHPSEKSPKRLTRFLNAGNRSKVASAIEKAYGAAAKEKFLSASEKSPKKKKNTPEEDAALDATLNEIKERNKQPYQFSRR